VKQQEQPLKDESREDKKQAAASENPEGDEHADEEEEAGGKKGEEPFLKQITPYLVGAGAAVIASILWSPALYKAEAARADKSDASAATLRTPVPEVTVETFKSTIKDAKNIVFLELYAPWCPFCKQIERVMRQVQYALDGISNIQCYKMDGDKLQDASLFDGKEEYLDGFPTLLLYGEDKSKPPLEIRKPNADKLLRDIHKAYPNAFDLEVALQRAKSVQEPLKAVLTELLTSTPPNNADWQANAPCGKEAADVALTFSHAKYADGEFQHAVTAFDTLTICAKEDEEAFDSFHHQLAAFVGPLRKVSSLLAARERPDLPADTTPAKLTARLESRLSEAIKVARSGSWAPGLAISGSPCKEQLSTLFKSDSPPNREQLLKCIGRNFLLWDHYWADMDSHARTLNAVTKPPADEELEDDES